MKQSFLMATFAVALAFTASSSYAAPAKEAAPSSDSASAPATTEALTDKQRVGRFFVGTGRAIGTGLKKTGKFLGKGIDKMIDKGAPKEGAPAAKP